MLIRSSHVGQRDDDSGIDGVYDERYTTNFQNERGVRHQGQYAGGDKEAGAVGPAAGYVEPCANEENTGSETGGVARRATERAKKPRKGASQALGANRVRVGIGQRAQRGLTRRDSLSNLFS